jgi:hypothetical protein
VSDDVFASTEVRISLETNAAVIGVSDDVLKSAEGLISPEATAGAKPVAAFASVFVCAASFPKDNLLFLSSFGGGVFSTGQGTN